MSEPRNFSWIEQRRLAASAQPDDAEEYVWLRKQGIDLIITLTEDPLRRDWLDDAGLLGLHVPITDMDAPTLEQIREVLSAIRRANDRGMGVAVHCLFGRGRTGTMLAAYFVEKGMNAREAIRQVRKLRPGSIETEAQEEIIEEFARSRKDPRA